MPVMTKRRDFLLGGSSAALATLITPPQAQAQVPQTVRGSEHWTTKKTDAGDVRLFMWRKRAADAPKGVILFVHGSSVSATPVFDLQIPGKPEASTMDWFARLGYDTWCVDCEGYGRSDKWRPVNADVSCGADDVAAAAEYIANNSNSSKVLLYGSSSGALRAGLFAQRHSERVQRVALDALVWTGEGSPTLEQRKKRLPEFRTMNRRPIDRAFVHSIFERDHPGTADKATIEAFADAILKLDDSVPTGTYVDMCSKLPLVDPAKLTVPTIVMRGEYDGIASVDDLLEFYRRLPNPDKQFAVMAGISHASFQQKNYLMVYHILHAFYTQPEPVYRA